MTAPQTWAPIDHVDATWEDLPRDRRCVPDYWF